MLLADNRASLCDLNGCLVSGETVLPGAGDFVAAAGTRLMVLSNNSTDTAESLSRRLARGGLEVAPGQIVLAGVSALESIAARAAGARVWVCGSGATVGHAEKLGLVSDDQTPAFVVPTRDTGFTYARLSQALGYLVRGAKLIAANADATHPGTDGVPVPETGALLSAIVTCLPDIEHEVIGKPYPGLFQIGHDRLGVASADAVMVGDNPAPDGAGAQGAGIGFI